MIPLTSKLWPGCDSNDTGYHRPNVDGECSDCGVKVSQRSIPQPTDQDVELRRLNAVIDIQSEQIERLLVHYQGVPHDWVAQVVHDEQLEALKRETVNLRAELTEAKLQRDSWERIANAKFLRARLCTTTT